MADLEEDFSGVLQRFLVEEAGQDMVEYSLLLAFIALAAVGLLSGIKQSLTAIWTSVSGNWTGAS